MFIQYNLNSKIVKKSKLKISHNVFSKCNVIVHGFERIIN